MAPKTTMYIGAQDLVPDNEESAHQQPNIGPQHIVGDIRLPNLPDADVDTAESARRCAWSASRAARRVRSALDTVEGATIRTTRARSPHT